MSIPWMKVVVEEVIEEAAYELKLDSEGAARVHEHREEFTDAIRRTVLSSLEDLSSINPYAEEMVSSNYGYPPEFETKDLLDQISRLRKIFFNFGSVNESLVEEIEGGKVDLPDGAEGWYAIPNWSRAPQVFFESYGDAMDILFGFIKCANGGKFKYRCEDRRLFVEGVVVRSPRTVSYLREISWRQGDPDILIIPAQTGSRYRGFSSRNVLKSLPRQEFAFDTFMGGCILLTHSDRLQGRDYLWMDCPGDQFYELSKRQGAITCFYAGDRGSEFDIRNLADQDDRFGSATGFLLDP